MLRRPEPHAPSDKSAQILLCRIGKERCERNYLQKSVYSNLLRHVVEIARFVLKAAALLAGLAPFLKLDSLLHCPLGLRGLAKLQIDLGLIHEKLRPE